MIKKNDIKFLRVTYLRGPNIWTYRPVLEAWLDIGELEETPSNLLPGFTERLTAWLPGEIQRRTAQSVPVVAQGPNGTTVTTLTNR